jgi:hypothetical protein
LFLEALGAEAESCLIFVQNRVDLGNIAAGHAATLTRLASACTGGETVAAIRGG